MFTIKDKHNGRKVDLKVEFARYQDNDQLAILLTEVHSGEDYATATVNIDYVFSSEKEVTIKGYSENSGLPELLVKHGILGELKGEVQRGFVKVQVYELTEPAYQFAMESCPKRQPKMKM